MTKSTDDLPSESLESTEARALGTASPKVEEVLAPALARLERHIEAGDELALLICGTRRDLTARERLAVVGGSGVDAVPLDRLLALTGGFSFKVASDLGMLGADPGGRSGDRSELVLDVVVLAYLSTFVPEVLSLARNRGDREVLQALTPVRTRLEEFHRLLVDRAAEACQVAAGRRARSALRLSDFGGTRIQPEIRPARPRTRVKREPVRRDRSKVAAISGLGLWRGRILFGLSIVLLVGSGLYLRRAAVDAGPPRVAEEFEAQDLSEVLPSATVLEADEDTRRARIAVGPEWRQWDRGERQQRVLAAVATLADRGYSRIEFVEAGGGLVASWQDGIISLSR